MNPVTFCPSCGIPKEYEGFCSVECGIAFEKERESEKVFKEEYGTMKSRKLANTVEKNLKAKKKAKSKLSKKSKKKNR